MQVRRSIENGHRMGAWGGGQSLELNFLVLLESDQMASDISEVYRTGLIRVILTFDLFNNFFL